MSDERPTVNPRTNPFSLPFFFVTTGEITTAAPPFCACALCPNGASDEDDDVLLLLDPKNGDREEAQARLMISPHSPGFDLNDDESNRERVGVAGMTPVKSLPDTLKEVRNDWLRDGSVPLNRLSSRFNEVNRSRAVISNGI